MLAIPGVETQQLDSNGKTLTVNGSNSMTMTVTPFGTKKILTFQTTPQLPDLSMESTQQLVKYG